MTTPHTYTTRTELKDFLSMSGRFIKAHVGLVIRDDGKQVWSSKGYDRPQTAAMMAGKSRKGFEHHAKTTGRCWRDDEDAKTAAKKAARDAAREADNNVRRAAPVLLEALEAVVYELERLPPDIDIDQLDTLFAARESARAAIALAKGGAK